MQIKIFTIPLIDGQLFEAELNQFLRAQKVIDVESNFVMGNNGTYWTFCVRYVEKAINDLTNKGEGIVKKDYKNLLSIEIFAIFSRLREIRKKIALEDAVPAFAVFTDEELSEIAKLENINISEVLKIKGIGLKKVEKYGRKMIELFTIEKAANEIKP